MGKVAATPTLSRWLLEAYSFKGLDVPDGLKAHSTRAMASSWAVAKGVSIPVVSLASNCSSPLTFATFYRLDIPVPHGVLPVLEVADPSFQVLGLTTRGSPA